MIISVLNTPLRIHTSSTFPTTFSVLMSSETMCSGTNGPTINNTKMAR